MASIGAAIDIVSLLRRPDLVVLSDAHTCDPVPMLTLLVSNLGFGRSRLGHAAKSGDLVDAFHHPTDPLCDREDDHTCANRDGPHSADWYVADRVDATRQR